MSEKKEKDYYYRWGNRSSTSDRIHNCATYR